MTEYLVIGHFSFLDDLKSAIQAMRAARQGRFEVFSPMPNHELEELLYENKRRSPVRLFTLIGSILGCLGGFLMTIWMSADWPLRTSAKPVVSIPAFVVIAFECTILLGGLFTIIALFHFCRLPNIVSSPGFSPQFSGGVFGLSVRVPKEETEAAAAILRECGANEVETKYVR